MPEEIERVRIDTFPDYTHTLPCRAPTTGLHGKFSLDFCVAVSLPDGRVDLASFRYASVERSELRRLLAATNIITCDEWAIDRRRENPATVQLQDGTTHSATLNAPLGSTENPLSDAELKGKFEYWESVAGFDEQQRAVVLGLLDDLVALGDVEARMPELVVQL